MSADAWCLHYLIDLLAAPDKPPTLAAMCQRTSEPPVGTGSSRWHMPWCSASVDSNLGIRGRRPEHWLVDRDGAVGGLLPDRATCDGVQFRLGEFASVGGIRLVHIPVHCISPLAPQGATTAPSMMNTMRWARAFRCSLMNKRVKKRQRANA